MHQLSKYFKIFLFTKHFWSCRFAEIHIPVRHYCPVSPCHIETFNLYNKRVFLMCFRVGIPFCYLNDIQIQFNSLPSVQKMLQDIIFHVIIQARDILHIYWARRSYQELGTVTNCDLLSLHTEAWQMKHMIWKSRQLESGNFSHCSFFEQGSCTLTHFPVSEFGGAEGLSGTHSLFFIFLHLLPWKQKLLRLRLKISMTSQGQTMSFVRRRPKPNVCR